MLAVKDCFGSQMVDITRDIKKELKVLELLSTIFFIPCTQYILTYDSICAPKIAYQLSTSHFQIMRDLRHDNLNSFIGACVEPEQIRIVSEYCTRGSLRYCKSCLSK